ncbi:ATP-binding protein [Meridianimarinicoccus sp. RP-17]|uniref:hybrid sensor histidine kinase/response regulator n=1 Tax=Meridianimarinicoccus zhengii TaxID=2056810 RepID=UPI000DAE6DDB|nr:ATP-binding protein [Phycocomes zhengii]
MNGRQTAPDRPRSSTVQSLVALGIAALVFGFIAIIIDDINDKLETLTTATSNPLERQFTQLEIDHLVLLRTLDTAETGSDLGDLRDRFDAFHSNLAPLRTGRTFADLRADPAFSTPLDAVSRTIDAAMPVMDGPDDTLLRALPDLRTDLTASTDDIRQIVARGTDHAAGRMDGGRISAAGTLRRLGLLTVALLGLLLAVVTHMWTLYRTARQNAVAAERSAARMAAVVENAFDAVVITDAAGSVQNFNHAAERMFGCARDEQIGRPVRDTLLPHGLPAPSGANAQTGTSQTEGDTFVTLTATRMTGESFPLEAAVTTSRDADGADMTVYFLRDITTRTHAERELRAARDAALAGERAKQRLLTVMSHEMRTPLNGILATVELLQDTALDDKQARYVSVIETSGKVLLGHVDDVLDISKMDSDSAVGAGRPIDFGTIVKEVVAELQTQAAANGTTLSVSVPDDARVIGDPIALRRVLTNLVGNSVKFTRDGSVDISADRLGAGDVVEFCIADTGIGIAPDDQARIFDDFTTLDTGYDRAQSGTGLGLGVVQRLVRQMGGDIGLESEPGEGSLFWIRVPLPAHAGTGIGASTLPSDGAARNALDVLVVEDNEINRLVVREMLQAAGHMVTEAPDGRAGVDAAETRRFDLILMDISMPRMDGVEATRRIRTGGGPCSDTPIVALTANALLHEVSIFRDAGMNETITKPISRRSLDRALVIAGEMRPPPETAQPVPTEADAQTRPTSPASPAPHAPDDPAQDEMALDRAQLDTLRSEIGRARADVLLGRFIDEADRAIADLTTGRPGETDEALAAVHKLAGSAAMFGAARLYARLREFDGMGKTGHGAEVPVRLHELGTIWAETRPVLRAAAEAPPNSAAP